MRGVLRASVLALYVLALLTATVAIAEEEPKEHLQGTIVSVDTKTETLVIRDPQKKGNRAMETKFSLSKKPRVLVNGNPASVADLKPGTEVKVAYKVDGKKWIAHTIETIQPKAAGDKHK